MMISPGVALALQVAEVEAVAEDAFVPIVVAPGLGSGRLVLDLARRSVGDNDFEVPAVDHFVAPVVVEIVDLEAHVVGQVVLPLVGLPGSPEHFAVEGHGRQATQFAVTVAGAVMQDLSDRARRSGRRRRDLRNADSGRRRNPWSRSSSKRPALDWLAAVGKVRLSCFAALEKRRVRLFGHGDANGREVAGPVRQQGNPPR